MNPFFHPGDETGENETADLWEFYGQDHALAQKDFLWPGSLPSPENIFIRKNYGQDHALANKKHFPQEKQFIFNNLQVKKYIRQ